jgi:hypothetical protein
MFVSRVDPVFVLVGRLDKEEPEDEDDWNLSPGPYVLAGAITPTGVLPSTSLVDQRGCFDLAVR